MTSKSLLRRKRPPFQIEDVKRLHLNDGDTLVLRVDPAFVTQEMIANLKTQMRDAFPDHATVVLAGEGMNLEVVGRPA